MTNLGLPVPQGFTVTTEACTRYYQDGQKIADEVVEQIYDAMEKTEQIVGKKFGDLDNPSWSPLGLVRGLLCLV